MTYHALVDILLLQVSFNCACCLHIMAAIFLFILSMIKLLFTSAIICLMHIWQSRSLGLPSYHICLGNKTAT